MAAKIFEVSDELPATTRLNITSTINTWGSSVSSIKTTDNYLRIDGYADSDVDTDIGIYINNVRYYHYGPDDFYNNDIDIIIDTSSWTIEQRTVTHVSGIAQ